VKRSLVAFAIALLAACGGAAVPPHPGLPPPPPVDRHAAACDAAGLAVADTLPAPLVTSAVHGNVRAIEFDGATADDRLKGAVGMSVGEAFDPVRGQAALRALYGLGSFDDVSMDVGEKDGGVLVRFHLKPRAVLGEVYLEGDVDDKVELGRTLHATSGESYSPVALASARRGILETLQNTGYQDARMDLKAARADDGKVDLCVNLSRGSKITVDKVKFVGLQTVPESELAAKVDSDGNRVNTKGAILDAPRMEKSVLDMAAMLFDKGMAMSEVHFELERHDATVTIVVKVTEGAVFHLRRYDVHGDLIADAKTYAKLLKTKSKDVFSRTRLMADVAAMQAFHKSKNREDLIVEPRTEIDVPGKTIDLIFEITDPKKPPKPAPPPPDPKKPPPAPAKK
jgi:outer membrane protein insertion porin family